MAGDPGCRHYTFPDSALSVADARLAPVDAASILHADLDAFFASVEQRDNPALRGRPVIVGGGVVLAASYEAKRRGVRTAMSGWRAKRLCPEAITVPPRMPAYVDASQAVFEVFHDTTPLVEGMSIDEAFLEVGGLHAISGTPAAIAGQLRRAVLERVGLPITVGVARTKFLAKIASGVAKPDGLLVVPPERELEFLHPLAIERLWGVGAVTAAKLHQRGIATIGDIARYDEAGLDALVGAGAGQHLRALAWGRDPRPVQASHRHRSIGAQHAPSRRPRTVAELDAMMTGLLERVCRRLRKAGQSSRTVVLRLRFGDFARVTRSRSLTHPSSDTEVLLAVARALLSAAYPTIDERGCTLIGIALTNLDYQGVAQPSLPFDDRDSGVLDATLDGVRERFGAGALTRATLLPGQPLPRTERADPHKTPDAADRQSAAPR